LAPTIGIAVDPRRQNLSEESLKANVERLQEYRKRLILFPKRTAKPTKGDASADEVSKARSGEGLAHSANALLPITNASGFSEGKKGDFTSEEAAYRKLREARAAARYAGARAKRAKAKEDEEAAKKK
jgi:large subunit ribosomal protein L13e